MLLNPNVSFLINNFIVEHSDDSMKDLTDFAREFPLTYMEISDLAKGLAQSGYILKNELSEVYYDIPSTGGPGSLSTLLAPLVLDCLGAKVLKLGVPGRPAGGIDVLFQLKNYKIDPSVEMLTDWIKSKKYVHLIANDYITPLDLLFFNYRKKYNSLNIPSLVVASILSKKIALGITNVGLDIRVSNFGNFGTDWIEARSNAELFNNVASLLGIKSKCFLSNGSIPQQPYIGRGESLLALYEIFNNNEDELLKKHQHYCYSMGISLVETNQIDHINNEALKKAFTDNLILQGSSYKHFEEKARATKQLHLFNISAIGTGFLNIDLNNIRTSIIKIQNLDNESRFPDTCGVILKKKHCEFVYKNEIICTVRCKQKFLELFLSELATSFSIKESINQPYVLEEVI